MILFQDVEELKQEIQSFEDNMTRSNGIINLMNSFLQQLKENEAALKRAQNTLEEDKNSISGLKNEIADEQVKISESVQNLKKDILDAQEQRYQSLQKELEENIHNFKENIIDENCNIKLSMFTVRTNLCYMIYPDFDRIAADLKLMQSATFS